MTGEQPFLSHDGVRWKQGSGVGRAGPGESAVQIRQVGLHIVAAHGHGRRWFQAEHVRRQRARHLIGNFVFKGKDFRHRAIEAGRPNQGAAGRVNELHCRPQPIRRALHAAIDQEAGIESSADFMRINFRAVKRK